MSPFVMVNGHSALPCRGDSGAFAGREGLLAPGCRNVQPLRRLTKERAAKLPEPKTKTATEPRTTTRFVSSKPHFQLRREQPIKRRRSHRRKRIEPARREVVRILELEKLRRPGHSLQKRANVLQRAELIAVGVNECGFLSQLGDEFNVENIDAQPYRQHSLHAFILNRELQAGSTPERKTTHVQGHTRLRFLQKSQRVFRVSHFATPFVVRAGGTTHAAKIETQSTDAPFTKRLRHAVGDVVVHRAAMHRVRVANERGSNGVFDLPEQTFEATVRSGNVDERHAKAGNSALGSVHPHFDAQKTGLLNR